MDTVTMVDDLLEDGSVLLIRVIKDGFKVTGACWISTVDDGRWILYISSPKVDEDGPLLSYRKVLQSLRSIGETSITSSNIVLIGNSHPIAMGIRGVKLAPYAVKKVSRVSPPLLGGAIVQDAFIYHPDMFTEPEEVMESEESCPPQGTSSQPVLPATSQELQDDPTQSGALVDDEDEADDEDIVLRNRKKEDDNSPKRDGI
jgi:hypothetical protein